MTRTKRRSDNIRAVARRSLRSAALHCVHVGARRSEPRPSAAPGRVPGSPQPNRDGRLDPDAVLALTLGRFKTPSARDLGQSAPYLHTGHQRSIEDVIRFYREMSDLAREGKMRNAPPEYFNMHLGEPDFEPLTAFLRSLNEDYRNRR